MFYSNVEELEAAPAAHRKNVNILRASMTSMPRPDDFETERRIRRELGLAKDADILLAHLRARGILKSNKK
jgi:hypothetical protein